MTVTGAEEYPVFESFDDYDLNENLDGRDTIDQARLGTGKLVTFASGCLQRLDYTHILRRCSSALRCLHARRRRDLPRL